MVLKPFSFNFRDSSTGGSCNLDPQTNLPDANCVFVASGDNSNVKSGYMAAPFLESVDHFCQNTEVDYHHDIYKPNKQNTMCDYTSVWEIILRNADFTNVKPMNNTEVPPATKFEILAPAEGGRIVLVLDRSASMDMNGHDRMDRVKQSSTRWIKYDVANGTEIGVTSFSTDTSIDQPLAKITDANRDIFVDAINGLKPKGGTCLGTGLMRGMDVSIRKTII